jgi:hypothetical protein
MPDRSNHDTAGFLAVFALASYVRTRQRRGVYKSRRRTSKKRPRDLFVRLSGVECFLDPEQARMRQMIADREDLVVVGCKL